MLRSFKLAFLVLSLSACANNKGPGRKTATTCGPTDLKSKHIKLATQANAKKFHGCFVNYFKLHKVEQLNLNACVNINIASSGRVSSVSLKPENNSSLSNDLKWCLTQEMWKMDYSKLQFSKRSSAKFNLNFKVRM
ncbi:MAG: hypothetical protein CME64_04465 [Halobacteriovoraceae bacterium]|nr:hypothetical protein [Halobacteriovoraceae bacterium]